MEKKRVKIDSYFEISENHEFFIWHFVQKNQHENTLELYSALEYDFGDNILSKIVDASEIPYFESYTEESIDFLNNLGYSFERLYIRNRFDLERDFRFSPALIGFNRKKKIISTLDQCYCLKGFISIIHRLNPSTFENVLEVIYQSDPSLLESLMDQLD